MPEYSELYDEKNRMRGLTDHGIGHEFDDFEEYMWSSADKRHIITNVSDENYPNDPEYEMAARFLDRQGDEWGLTRKENETNTDYRARILSIIQNNITIKGIKEITASVLNITTDQVEITNNREQFTTGDLASSCLLGGESKPAYNHLVNARGVIFIKVHEVEDIEFLKGVLENCVLANVEIIILYSKILLVAGNPLFANVGDNITFTVMLVDQSDMALSGKPIFFYSNNEYIGSSETDSEGKASININNVQSGRYDLKARYSKTWSDSHIMLVKRGLSLFLDGENQISEEELLNYTVTANDLITGEIVRDLIIELYVNGELYATEITNRDGRVNFKYLADRNGQYELSARVLDHNIYHDTFSNPIWLNVNLFEEISPDDLVITLTIPTGLTSHEIEDLKQEAEEKEIFGEKIPLYNFPYHGARLFLNSSYNNLQMFHKRKKLRHHFTKKFDIPLYTVEFPYSRFEEELEITIVVYADESKIFGFDQDIFRHYYDINNGFPKGFIYDDGVANRPRVDFVVRSMEDDTVIPRATVKFNGQTYTANNNGYVRVDNNDTGVYTIEVSRPGYVTRVFEREFDISKEITVRLDENRYTLDVEVNKVFESDSVDNYTFKTINILTGEPLPSSKVKLLPLGYEEPEREHLKASYITTVHENDLLEDLSDNNNHGIMHNFNNLSFISNYMRFNGMNNYVDTGIVNDDLPEITMEATILLKDKSNDKALFGSETEKGLYAVWKDNNLIVGIRKGNTNRTMTINSSDLPFNEWLHVLVTYDNTNFNFYVNGELKAHRFIDKLRTDEIIMFGKSNNSYYSGNLRTFKIYDKALNKDEVIDSYNYASTHGYLDNSVVFTVTDYYDNLLSDVKITVGEHEITTDSKGEVTLYDFIPGIYDIMMVKKGYKTIFLNREILNGDEIDIVTQEWKTHDVTIKAISGSTISLFFNVTHDVNDELVPLANADIKVTDKNREYNGTTDNNGLCELKVVNIGNKQLSVTHNNYPDWEYRRTIRVVDDETFNIELKDENYVLDDLLLRYEMNNPMNTDNKWSDLSPNGNDGVLFNGNINLYKSDGSMEFDGTQYVETINQDTWNAKGGTCEVILKFNARTHTTGVVGDYGSNFTFIFFYWEGATLVGGLHGSYWNYPIPSADIPEGYIHLACTYDKNMFRVYVNGVEMKATAIGDRLILSNIPTRIGRATNVATQYLKANMKYFSMYDRPLSAEEIKQNYEEHQRRGLL
jgi:hypothetical protein